MTNELARVAESLQRLGYRAKISTEFGDTIESASDGLIFYIILGRTSCVQFYIFIGNEEEPFSLERINRFNGKFRAYKVYYNKGIVMTLDIYYKPNNGEDISEDTLNEWLTLWSLGLGLLKTELFSIDEKSEA